MDTSTIFKKEVEISSLQESDLMVRRLFILMDGKRTLGDLLKVCRIPESECKELILDLWGKGHISILESVQKKHNSDVIVAEPKKDTIVIKKKEPIELPIASGFKLLDDFNRQ